jgi:glycosyltransferase involved in cell wall biosynthesis
MTIRTLHLETGRHLLGGAMQTKHLVHGLEERGVPALLVCPDDGELYRAATREGLNVQGVRYRGDHDLTLVLKLGRIIRSAKPDIVHLHSRRGADILGALAAKWVGHPNVIITRRVDNPISVGMLNGFCIGKIPKAIVCVSGGISDVIKEAGFPSDKITVIHSAVDAGAYDSALSKWEARRILGVLPASPLLCVIGQLIARKGHHVLLDALPSLRNKFKDIRVLIVGSGAVRSRLEAQVHKLNLDGCVQFMGFRSDISTILRASDLLVHPALREGFANVGLQAMASGIPVVTTSVGGMPEMVQHEITGLVVPPGDSKTLAQAIEELLSNPGRRSMMGRLGQDIVRESFSVEKMVDSNLALYQKVLASRPS